MTDKKTKSQVEQEDKVHVDFTGDIALFIRRMSLLTGRSNNECGHLLMQLIMSAEETITINLEKDAILTTKNEKPPVKFKRQSVKQIKIQL